EGAQAKNKQGELAPPATPFSFFGPSELATKRTSANSAEAATSSSRKQNSPSIPPPCHCITVALLLTTSRKPEYQAGSLLSQGFCNVNRFLAMTLVLSRRAPFVPKKC